MNMIIKLDKEYQEQIGNIIYQSLKPYFPKQPKEWFLQQLGQIDYSLAFGLKKEGELIGVAILKEENDPIGKLKGKGLRGDVLAILPEHQKQGVGSQIVIHIKTLFPDVNYFWGTQAHSLPNEGFWGKHSKIYHSDEKRRYSCYIIK